MLPVLLLLLQLPLTIEGPVWAVPLNALALAGSLYCVPEARAGLHYIGRTPLRNALRSAFWWRAVLFAHVAIVPPWCFFRPAGQNFAFPGLIAIGLVLGCSKLIVRAVARYRTLRSCGGPKHYRNPGGG